MTQAPITQADLDALRIDPAIPFWIGPPRYAESLKWNRSGKRGALCVLLNQGGMGRARFLRWYVGGRIARTLRVNPANVALTRRWLAGEYIAD